MSVSIIILTWNGLSLTRRCLDSLRTSAFPPDFEIIVVDNGSNDGTLEFLAQDKTIKLIKNKTNIGYGAAINIGIQQAKNDSDIVLLNNDVYFVNPNWLIQLERHSAEFPRDGVIGVKILKENGRLQHCGAYLPLDTWWGQQTAGGECDIGQYSGIVECESVVFACVYIKRQVFQSIGNFDERFFAYFEDTDFCMRAKQAGFNVVINGDVRVVHAENSSTRVNKVNFDSIFKASQRKFREKWERELLNTRYKNGCLDFKSVINFPSGYASSMKNFAEELDRQHVRVAYEYVYGPKTSFPVIEPQKSESYLVDMIRRRKFGDAPVQVVYATGDAFEKNSGHYKIGFTMLEVDGVPAEWVRQANLMNEVWVPSYFNKETFSQSGVNVPIFVVPLGVDPAYFSPQIVGFKKKNIYSFLSVFEWGERKAPEILLKAFSDEFKNSENVVLICKVNNSDSTINIKAQIAEMKLRSSGGRVVIAENRMLRNYELGVLYRSVDCFVLPTRGEGWGMPILEAMACGLPVISTKWSAQLDFMNESNSYLIDVEKTVPAIAKCPYYEGFQWAQPSYEHLRYLMRKVFDNHVAAENVGKRAAIDARQLWTWKNSTQKIISRMHGIA